MHLDGVFGQAQFGGDLFVQQAIGQAQQHAELLRRELREAGGQFGVGFCNCRISNCFIYCCFL